MLVINTLHKDIAALCSGILLLFAFAPYDYGLLAIPAMSLLFYSWQQASPLRAAFRGLLSGLTLFIPGLYWVYISLHDFGGAGVLLASSLTLAFATFWALFPALAAWLTNKFQPQRQPALSALNIASIWVLIEYLRGALVFNGFPLFQLAYSQLDSPLAGYIPLLGAYGCSWICAFIAAMFANWLSHIQRPTYLSLSAVLLFWLFGWLLTQQHWTYPAGENIKVTLLQGNVAQDKKWQPEYREAILQLYKQQTEQHWDSQVIIWPESSIPAYYQDVKDSFLLPLQQQAQQHDTDLILSLPLKNQQGQKFNAVMTLGKQQAVYKKIHLLPFGEYIPLQAFFASIMGSLDYMPIGSFSAGTKTQPLLYAGGQAFLTSICYEDAFGEENASRLGNATYLVNVTNDGWFGESAEPYTHMQLARMRALETGRYLLRATNNGLTAIVAPNGKIVKQAPLFKVASLTANITPMRGSPPYVHLGDDAVLFMSMLVLCLSMLLMRRAATTTDS